MIATPESMTDELFATGFVPVLDAATYHAIDAASASTLKVLKAETAEDLKWVMDHGTVDTEAMKRGDATHAIMLEHDRFKSMYVVAGVCEAMQGDGKACEASGKIRSEGHWYCGRHNKGKVADTDLVVISVDQHHDMLAMRDALRKDKDAREIMESPGWNECSLFWIDEQTGERCKTRIDMLKMYKGKLCRVDLKTTRNAAPGPRGFASEAAKLGMSLQAVMNLEGLSRVKNEIDVRAINIAVECKPNRPAKVCIYEFETDILIPAEEEFRALLDRYHECRESGDWPGYPTGIQKMERPAWDMPESDSITLDGETI